MSALALAPAAPSLLARMSALFPIARAGALPWLAAPLGALAGLRSLLELLPPIVLAVPKSKISHSRKSMRSANKGIKPKMNFSHCEACGTVKLQHHMCPKCFSEISRKWKGQSRAPPRV
ncbi:hypothetical protein CC85DRAFT_286806 [Cutaneotrichosporon oleaginosum]|uniref:Large ribosomal subunit protein bL32m n=1 Tax=Cutaneotrichosporon oleaginosum TaxID=879819 RepID=A0A0J0XJ82_9TREE|nr:uncharacterized protein CC85DRAFT_286806 [Cutaneotrichosporon oleaginosum]KLT41121.1 hypothetical protein CC85DRAFT_286806 [Cutaneotrichosporon oleaginosum]TXT05747.1 hypothetical protein COLE_07067 [Cutaneotrichosporon oleaginosum]